VKLWKRDGTLLNTLSGHSWGVNAVSFSPDGETITSGSSDGTMKLWKRDGTLLNTLSGHSDVVSAVSFSPDGETIASGSYDGTMKLWKRDGTLLKTLSGHSDGVSDVSFSSDGETIASASSDNTVKLWNLNLDDLLGRGCTHLQDYLKNPNNGMEKDDPKRQLCDDVPLSAGFFQDRGIALAQQGKIDLAVAQFQKAKELDPQTEAQRLAAQTRLTDAFSLLSKGKVKEAITTIKQAYTLDPNLEISADDGNYLCRRSSLNGYAKDVLFACEKAVQLAPEAGYIRDSRGLARALTGNKSGAIEDFQSAIQWIDKLLKEKKDLSDTYKAKLNQWKRERQGWINALKAGKNPFMPEVLKKLRESG
jgi:tetratricopeptide (TPR) repeat protein